MKPLLNSTARIALCLSLGLATPVVGQSADVAECASDKKDRIFPCVVKDVGVVENQKEFRAALKDARKDAAQPAEEVAEEVEETTDTTVDAQADVAPEGTGATDESSAAAQTDAGTQEVDGAEAETTADAGTPPPPAGTETGTDQEVTAVTETETVAPEVSVTPPEKTGDDAVVADTSENAPAPEILPDPAQAQDSAAAPSAEVAEAQEAPVEDQTDTTAGNVETTEQGTDTPVAAAAAAAAADGENQATADEVEVTTETVTEENSRSSDEEFDTQITSQASSASETTQKKAKKKDDDDGLSNFEKAILLGLGAIGVGQLLDNGDEVVSRSADRLVVERDGELRVLKDDDALLRQPGSDVRTETFRDGSTRTTVTRADTSQIVTIRAADGRVLSRTKITPEGEAIVIFDDTQPAVQQRQLPEIASLKTTGNDENAALVRALEAELGKEDAAFSLEQVRSIPQLRALAPQVGETNINFASGSSAIRPEQARSLAQIGLSITDKIKENPRAVFLIEGHTDAVGSAAMNLALSDRRAESVALALTEYFEVPPENLIVQGYGESSLKLATLEEEPANRRAVVRDITQFLR